MGQTNTMLHNHVHYRLGLTYFEISLLILVESLFIDLIWAPKGITIVLITRMVSESSNSVKYIMNV